MAAVKFASKCRSCGVEIPVGSGDVRKGDDGKWVTTCDEHKPRLHAGANRGRHSGARRMAPNPRSPQGFPEERFVRMTDGERVVLVCSDDVHDAVRDGFRRA